MDTVRQRLLHLAPDAPRTMHLRALLRNPRARILGDLRGALVIDDDLGLGVVHERPPMSRLAPLLGDILEILSPEPLEGLPPGWHWGRGVVMTLQDEAALARWQLAGQDIIRCLDAGLLAWVPDPLKEPLEDAMAHGVATCAVVGGRPVAFASAPLRTETRFDLAVDTLEAFRCRGLARMAAARLIGLERGTGHEPLWGALESNTASIRAGMGLGFALCDQLWLACRTG